jgi:TolB-like protein/DNA-binding winged helix-turn-helix (wHTH) protein/Tfp pilus assembly protein PilF
MGLENRRYTWQSGFMSVEIQAGKHRLDLSRYQLSRDGRPLKLERQPMELLIFFVQRKGQLVTRDDIVEKLWGKDVFVDVDRSINAAVRKIRSALKDDPGRSKYLETVVGKGYRFIGDVEVVSAPSVTVQELAGRKSEPVAAPKSYRLGAIFQIVGLLVVLVGVATWSWVRWHLHSPAEHSNIHSLAVLPLANLSGDPSQDYLAEGMTDELITELAKISSLRVISRTSIIRYQDTKKTLPEIAKELRIGAVIEGTVFRSGDKLRITAQLVEANTDRHLWAESYERDFRDVLSLQREVAGKIAEQVNTALTPAERSKLGQTIAVNSQAFDANLRGRFFMNKWTEDGVGKGIGYFQQAIQADPNNALAYAGLAESYISLGDIGVGILQPQEANAEAESAALKAISLDETLAEGHLALAISRFRCDRDLAELETEFKRTIDLNPSSAGAHHWYSHYLLARGRVQEALAEAQRAYDLSPVDPDMGVHLQWLNYYLHNYDEVILRGRQTEELDPNFSETHWFMGLAYEQRQKYKAAGAELQMAVKLSERRVAILSSFGHFLGISGDRHGALKILTELNLRSRQRYVPSYDKALLYMGLGDDNRTLAELGKAYKEGSFWMLTLQSDPRFDPLRSDARFQELVRRVGVTQ